MKIKKTILCCLFVLSAMLQAACDDTGGPEAALWGEWVVDWSGSTPLFLAETLAFYQDGRLVLDGDQANPAEYAVIAPGRMKITHNGESQVVNYSVEDGQLEVSIEGENHVYRQVAGSDAVGQSVEDGLRSSNVEAPPGSAEAQETPTQFSFTNTPIETTLTQVPPATPTATSPPPTFTPTVSLEGLYVDFQVNEKDGMPMVFVPEGEFIMGSNPTDDPYFWGAEGPAHDVYVDAFWIYQTEVTNAMFQACVAEQACPKPLRNESRRITDYYTAEKYADYPVIQVNWTHASAYCVWAGGRLPTEAEWEKAARGTDGRLFPWGNANLTPQLASFCGSNCPDPARESFDDGYVEAAPVGTFPAGASPYGALDMAGNVWEWTFDFFSPLYYDSSPYLNPRGPVSGTRRAIRGGGWNNPSDGIRTVSRTSLPPQDGLDTVGFRCVVDVD
jgi:formylglycine-generating enzyme required for sulfatase activity